MDNLVDNIGKQNNFALNFAATNPPQACVWFILFAFLS